MKNFQQKLSDTFTIVKKNLLSAILIRKAVILIFLFFALKAFSSEEITLKLALDLAQEEHESAALEFRRLALSSATETTRAGYALAAACFYNLAGARLSAENLLNYAESLTPGLETPITFLRAETAFASGDKEAAEFHWQILRGQPDVSEPLLRYTARHSAAVLLELKKPADAQAILSAAPGDNLDGLKALKAYNDGHDKTPVLGGALGLIPGLGYLYAGEYANAARSLILNSLFIFGMINTASHDDWGAFGVISFFEFTWYSGSIYGGIDAVQRYNQKRLTGCQNKIIGNADYKLNLPDLPLITLNFEF